MRGNRYPPACRITRQRSIPACAGEPRYGPGDNYGDRVYPRLCGGTNTKGRFVGDDKGLSLPVRGNQGVARNQITQQRSIPACAGEPNIIAVYRYLPLVYPRLCGGTATTGGNCRFLCGLSPPVRGNPNHGRNTPRRRRSIPACAGEPPPSIPPRRHSRVYPRLCGGTNTGTRVDAPAGGLSPPVRGNHHGGGRDHRPSRSIPACAGEPSGSVRILATEKVYPRLYGGTSVTEYGPSMAVGLSPPVRGNPMEYTLRSDGVGSIPACAGEPTSRFFLASRLRVYPRLCGGTPHAHGIHAGAAGLSPPVRGNRPRLPLRPLTPRSIPACAGEPS